MKEKKIKALKKLKKKYTNCNRCGLCHMRSKIVFGRGGFRRGIVLVGESPGPQEDKRGDPFVGRAGSVLDKLLRKADLKRNDTFITNAVLCYPGRNAEVGGFNKPSEEEMIRCASRLKKTIAILRPKLVVAMGNVALFALTSRTGIAKNRGLSDYHESGFSFKLFVVYHPAALLRRLELRRQAKEDWIKIKEFLDDEKSKSESPKKFC